jgi:hypothetical protein
LINLMMPMQQARALYPLLDSGEGGTKTAFASE